MTGFFADNNIDLNDYIVESYFFESVIDPKAAAESLCQEQSTAQWKRVGVEEDFRHKHGAKIIDLRVVSSQEKSHWCEVKIAHPHVNFGPKIPNILTAAAGEGAFFSHGITTIKLTDITFPDNFLEHFEGPKFGIDGVREFCNIHNRPIFIGVVKPNIGLTPKDFAELAGEAFLGGLDIAKDDELLGDTPWSPLKERVQLCADVAKRAEDKTGEKKIFLANITDEVSELLRLHDVAVEAGAKMIMVNAMAIGLSATRMLSKHSSVPVVAHFDCIAPLSRIPFHGISSELITKLQRICGCDIIIMPGFGERMKTADAEVMANVKECIAPLGNIKTALPTPGGSDWAGTLKGVYERLKTPDFGFVPGRGIFGHPMGPRGGAKSLREAWDAIAKGIDPKDHLHGKEALTEAFRAFS